MGLAIPALSYNQEANLNRRLEPGCYVEFQDFSFKPRYDDRTLKDTLLRLFMKILVEAGKLNQRPLDCVQNYECWMKEAGFEEVKKVTFTWQENPWRTDLGEQTGRPTFEIFTHWAESLSMALFTRILGQDKDFVKSICERVATELSNLEIRAYFQL